MPRVLEGQLAPASFDDFYIIFQSLSFCQTSSNHLIESSIQFERKHQTKFARRMVIQVCKVPCFEISADIFISLESI